MKFGAAAKGEEKKEHVGAESAEQMRIRTARFVDDHLAPLWTHTGTSGLNMTPCVIVVAHGIILGVLFKVLCSRLSHESRQGGVDSSALMSAPSLAWSNTGYLEMTVTDLPGQPRKQSRVEQVNCIVHLKGLKKTRGGIGSARFDERQRTMDSFFGATSKKRKLDDAAK
jgi:2,3-bisphosphoglycerate-dependent phosphoglycerate mutase